jgi:hypothetical protein
MIGKLFKCNTKFFLNEKPLIEVDLPSFVLPSDRKLKAKWSSEMAQDLLDYYSMSEWLVDVDTILMVVKVDGNGNWQVLSDLCVGWVGTQEQKFLTPL